jgi:hypothetical protein
VGAIPDGNSALMLVPARLRHLQMGKLAEFVAIAYFLPWPPRRGQEQINLNPTPSSAEAKIESAKNPRHCPPPHISRANTSQPLNHKWLIIS